MVKGSQKTEARGGRTSPYFSTSANGRLYHLYKFISIALIFLVGCVAPQITQGLITIRLTADGKTAEFQVPAGSTAQEALQIADVTVETLDRTEPPLYTVLTNGSWVNLIRVMEAFTIEQVITPFDKQVMRNEALAEGETRLVQPGVNGLQEVTYRRVYEDDVEVSVNVMKSVVLQEAVPEIEMVGSQPPFEPVAIMGRLAFLAAGNAWVMESSTGNRRPVVTTADLDGRVFKLSPDGDWLLITRRSDDEDAINSLWAAKISDGAELLVDLGVRNVVHFADWSPNSVLRVAYSTVEPRSTAPGWQANNDLNLITFSSEGWVSDRTVALESNSGGIYGWWGTSFVWAPDGLRLGFARPDGVGILDLQESAKIAVPKMAITPLQTQSDWAWVPGLTWAPTGNVLYTVDHAIASGVASQEESPLFDLTAIPLEGGAPIRVIQQSGMFAYPVPSPLNELSSGEQAYQVAFLQAIFPTQSKSSHYRLVVMDRDGSNRRVLFPEEGAPGLAPQQVLWSPGTFDEMQNYWLAVLYQGNVWLVDSTTGEAHQLTGDGLIDRLDWR